jgi:hypothetical protein
VAVRELGDFLGVKTEVEIRNDGIRPESAAIRGEILAVSDLKSSIAIAADEMARLID